MTLRRLLAAILLFSVAFYTPAQAQTSGYYGASNAYTFGGNPGSFGYQNGGSTNVFDIGFRTGNSLNILGCGGIGMFNFINTTFNMNNVIDQLKKNLTTFLAKQLLIQAMSIPQVSAIFDTLNAFGNARFNLFNQSCNLSSIKKEAKEKTVEACTQRNGGSAEARLKCTNDFDQDADVFKDLKTAFKNICGFMNFNASARGQACKNDDGTPSSACSLMAFIPQFRFDMNGGVGSSASGAMCQTSTDNFGMKPPALPLPVAGDVLRSVSDIIVNKAVTQVAGARASGASYAVMQNCFEKTEALCAKKEAPCDDASTGAAAAAMTNPASPGFVRLATVDLKQFGFAGAVPDTSDAALAEFKRRFSCNNADPLKFQRVMAQVCQQDNPGITFPSIDFTDKDVKDFTKGLNFNISGDATAASNLGIDTQAATTMLQIAATCEMARKIKIDTKMLIDLEYKQGPSCREAYRAGLTAQATHGGLIDVFTFMKSYSLGLKQAIISKKLKPTGADPASSDDDTTMSDDTQKKYLKAVEDAQRDLETDLRREQEAYAQAQHVAELSTTPGACKEGTGVKGYYEYNTPTPADDDEEDDE